MGKDWKYLAGICTVICVFMLLLTFGFKAIDYYFPSPFDKLIHCNQK